MICSADSKRKESMKVIQNNSKIKIAEFGTFAVESTCVHEERLETESFQRWIYSPAAIVGVCLKTNRQVILVNHRRTQTDQDENNERSTHGSIHNGHQVYSRLFHDTVLY